MDCLIELINQHKDGEAVGIYSVCSAHPLVLEAALQQGLKDNKPVLIEATSNQVNQFGGYTGMQAKDFAEMVYQLADKVGLAKEQVLLGGDHLGPNCWQSLDAEDAMAKSEVLIDSYVAAGFRKIHLDCSMSCKGDPVPVTDEIVAERAAHLCKVAEDAWQKVGGEKPVYIVGTEVPVPGGAQENLENELELTKPEDAVTTINAHRDAFEKAGVSHAWSRVVGLVVQPGVEFDHHKVIIYQSEKAQSLSKVVDQYPQMVFEAHSTDYQIPAAYNALVQDHFAILKVGPALTFALREALFALDLVEQEWLGVEASSKLRETVEKVMTEEPKYWQSYYQEEGHQLKLDRVYSLSDRIRYYWPHTDIQRSLEKLFENLASKPAPLTILSQYLPEQMQAIARGEIDNTPEQIVINKIMEVTAMYSQACFQNS
ncbi:MAG TPA: D-tagatose-bisphosphate aldolase, class II, non-catalytic subunit [Vibrio sp.]|uniref:D-tagatose-bisphosphate aldolase, class II, non-catalytic subunit n=1 Tax=Vibrio sp. TaxID=678 RepID=UPI000EDE2ED9|nr:D-tagatose-bisphosphate aldolase, class II, non-catalytic subunit [Vibrio sp.]HCH01239.1 D-tagatose-bisphosphate aldolase, class II, non-catalytic subunit [Vibrio sp.]